MISTISETTQKARKDYVDGGGEYVRESLEYLREDKKVTFTEWRAIAGLKANNWLIKKGQLYIRTITNQDGDLYTFKSLPAIQAICDKYDLYPEY